MASADQITAYIERAHNAKVAPNDSLLDSGLLDSMGIFELVKFLEETFGVPIEDEAIVPENFETVASIAAFMDKKRSGASG